MNEQREIIYGERRRVLDGESMRDTVYNMITEYVENITDRFASPEAAAEDWDVKGLELNLHKIIPMMELPSEKECIDMRQKELKHLLKERAVKAYEVKHSIVCIFSRFRKDMDRSDKLSYLPAFSVRVRKCHPYL